MMQGSLHLSAIQRYDLEESFTELAATAIRMRHPQAVKLARTRRASLSNEQMAVAVLKLTAWIAEQAASEPTSERG